MTLSVMDACIWTFFPSRVVLNMLLLAICRVKHVSVLAVVRALG